MARTRLYLQLAVPTLLRALLLGSSVALLTLFIRPEATRAEDNQQTIQSQADTLTQQGHQQLDQGQAVESLASWQAATKLYREVEYQEGITGSLINQSLALQAMGHNLSACRTLLSALELEQWVCPSPLTGNQVPESPETLLAQALQQKPDLALIIPGLQSLGDVLRSVGRINESEVVLTEALTRAKRMNLAVENLLLSMGDTQQALYNQANNLSQISGEPLAQELAIRQAQAKARAALKVYQQVADSPAKSSTLQARLYQLSFLLDLQDSDDLSLQALQQQTRPQIQPLIGSLMAADFSSLSGVAGIEARLNFAESLLRIGQKGQAQLVPGAQEPLAVAMQSAQAALKLAQDLDEDRSKSFALGTIGRIYKLKGQPAQAQEHLEAALGIAPLGQAWDLIYQWHEELAPLYQQAGDRNQAIKAYAAAIDSLEQVRTNLLAVDADIQFSFKETVEPVYQSYMRLLLAAPNPDLEQVIRTNEQLQIAELENFLQCGRLDQVSLSEANQTPNPVTAIHILNLGDQYEVIVRSPDGSMHRHTPEAAMVKKNADNLLLNLQDSQFVDTAEEDFLANSQALYQQFILPIKPYLPPSGTLIFVLDSVFQTLPMAILHDGQDYLLQNYNVATTLGSQLRQPQALGSRKPRALIAALSEKSPSFQDSNAPKNLSPLPEVEKEVASVENNTRSTVLLNEAFSRDRLQKEINTSTFPVLHLTTHGQFSSDPKQTVLLAWNQVINVRELDRLLRSNGNQNSIELLVLSACQTARGDERSALGIAGVAAQAGARSTLASLWLVDANATAMLMETFYRGLSRGLPKAEALQQAQLSLLAKSEFSHPAYWAGFILVGSWL